MKNQFIEYISQFIELDEEEVAIISERIKIEEFRAGDQLLKMGSTSTLSYFSLKGCVRRFYLIDGEEKTTFFYTENKFITSFRSFHAGTPSDHYLECVEDSILALIPYDAEQDLLERIPKLESFARVSLEQELAGYQEMLSSYIISTPEQRYLNLLENNPDLFQRVPLYQLASYIGVKAESLSRIRNRISKKSS